jgi:hypothetical protein
VAYLRQTMNVELFAKNTVTKPSLTVRSVTGMRMCQLVVWHLGTAFWIHGLIDVHHVWVACVFMSSVTVFLSILPLCLLVHTPAFTAQMVYTNPNKDHDVSKHIHNYGSLEGGITEVCVCVFVCPRISQRRGARLQSKL